MATTVAQEYYKLQEAWEDIAQVESWKLAIWVAEYPDVDIIDKFMQIEQSPIGQMDDLFFRFDSSYQGDIALFEQALWQEFSSWFSASEKPEMDLHQALFEQGLIREKFVPDSSLAPTAKNLWQELVRFRALIKDLDQEIHCCLYFPIVGYNKHPIAEWFKATIQDVPAGIRLVTMDFAQDRKLKNLTLSKDVSACVYLHPKLDMLAAIKNEMGKDSSNFDTVDLHARFRQQVIRVMESTTATFKNATSKAVNSLLEICKDIGTAGAHVAGLLVAAQAYYAIKDTDKSEAYTNQALAAAETAMQQNDPSGYPTWKSCMLLKAALCYGRKERKEALLVYEELADRASKNGDAYYLMEGQRLAGHLYYELGKLENSLQQMLLALAAGSYLDLSLRRQSTFLHAAYMALYLAQQRRSQSECNELRLQLQDWLGDDWETVMEQADLASAKTKMKSPLFNFLS